MLKLSQSGIESFQSIKCGEIFFSTQSSFTVICSLCECDLSLEDFVDHFHLEHLTIEDDVNTQLADNDEPVQKQPCDSSLIDDIYNTENEEAEYDLVEIEEGSDENSVHVETSVEDNMEEEKEYLEITVQSEQEDESMRINEELKKILEEDLEEDYRDKTILEEETSIAETAQKFKENKELEVQNSEKNSITHITKSQSAKVIAQEVLLFDEHSLDKEEELEHIEITSVKNSEYTDDDFIGFAEIDEFQQNSDDSTNGIVNIKDNSRTEPIPDDKPIEELAYNCLECDNSYHTQHGLQVHMRNAHNPERMNKNRRPLKPPNKCSQCNQIFRSSRDLAAHMFKHTGIVCDVCGRSFAQIAHLSRHKIRHSTKNFKCELCEKPFFTAKEVKQHMVSHTNTVAVICEVCGKGCRNSTVLNAHMRRHTGERPAKCDVCGKRFYSQHDLKVHAVAHTSERPFECDICHSTFQRKKALRIHKLIHTKDRKHECKICGRCYTQSSGLKLHLRTHNAALNNGKIINEETKGLSFEDMVLKNVDWSDSQTED